MRDVEKLSERLLEQFSQRGLEVVEALDEVTATVPSEAWLEVCTVLRDAPEFGFEQLSDLCGVDYSAFGEGEWKTQGSTNTGYSRGVVERATGRAAGVVKRYGEGAPLKRFAVVCHLLSYSNNRRLRLRTFAPDDELPVVGSVSGVWPGALWFEREAFDLFGIVFEGHPDLRRILTDYGFVGHPFRKDFPLVGHVEMRYDPERKRVVYEPVSIEPRVLVPRVVREDNRYGVGGEQSRDA